MNRNRKCAFCQFPSFISFNAKPTKSFRAHTPNRTEGWYWMRTNEFSIFLFGSHLHCCLIVRKRVCQMKPWPWKHIRNDNKWSDTQCDSSMDLCFIQRIRWIVTLWAKDMCSGIEWNSSLLYFSFNWFFYYFICLQYTLYTNQQMENRFSGREKENIGGES